MRKDFFPADIPFILQAYVDGIQTAFIVAIALAATCTIIAFKAKWQKLQGVSKVEEANSTELSTKAIDEQSIV